MKAAAVPSLGVLTDFSIHELSGATIRDHGEYLVVSTRSNPHYRWGNFIHVLGNGAERPLQEWERIFDDHFPDAGHRCFGFSAQIDHQQWSSRGYECEVEETLCMSDAPRQSSCPEGYTVAAIRDGLWDQLTDFKIKESMGAVENRARFEHYIRQRHHCAQQLQLNDCCEYYGAFLEDQLVASLGIVVCPAILGSTGIARYQSVVTAVEHRGRGLASHLLGVAGQWALSRSATTWVICTETTNAAGRIYRRAGFSPIGQAWGAEMIIPSCHKPQTEGS